MSSDIKDNNNPNNDPDEEKELNSEFIEIDNIKPKITIDLIIDKIGYNYYHFIFIAIVGLAIMSEGIEIYITYIIAPILQEKNNVSSYLMSFATSCVFIGFFFGSFFSGLITRTFERKYPLTMSLGILSLFNLLCVAWDNLYWFCFCRLIIGFNVGFVLNLLTALSEILPKHFRDFIIGSIFIFWKIGTMYFVSLSYFMLDENNHDQWKLVIILAGIPVYSALILALIFYDESPRLLFANGKINEGFNALKRLAKKSNIDISDEDRDYIIKQLKENIYERHPTYLELAKAAFSYVRLSTLLFFIWIFIGLVDYTSTNALPVFISKTEIGSKGDPFKKLSHDSLKHILYINIGPIFIEPIIGLITSFPFFGRKNTIIFGLSITGIFAFIQIFVLDHYFIMSAIILMGYPFATNIIKLYNIEAYPTSLRDFSFGLFQSTSRLTNIFIPFMVNYFFSQSLYAASIAIVIYSVIGLVLTIALPYDTYGISLDIEDHEELAKLKKV